MAVERETIIERPVVRETVVERTSEPVVVEADGAPWLIIGAVFTIGLAVLLFWIFTGGDASLVSQG
jgi:hypothetical protein